MFFARWAGMSAPAGAVPTGAVPTGVRPPILFLFLTKENAPRPVEEKKSL